jgi:hypothetical protein
MNKTKTMTTATAMSTPVHRNAIVVALDVI